MRLLLLFLALQGCGRILVVGAECNVRLTCEATCVYGFETDANGCRTCSCKPPPPAGSDAGTDGGMEIDGGACADVPCNLTCEYGYQRDRAGCEICGCRAPPAEGVCPQTPCSVQCDQYQRTREGCLICACAPPRPPPDQCSPIACDLSCERYVRDQNQCSMCECELPSDGGNCPPFQCRLACTYGYKTGLDGCEVCACAPRPGCGMLDGCTLACEGGFAVDPMGCKVCACEPPVERPDGGTLTCPPVPCNLHCPDGYERGPDGCEYCACVSSADGGR